MESRTYLKNVKISPKKLRFIVRDIKKYKPLEAVNMLVYAIDKPSRIMYKAINSALTNARSTMQISDDLIQFKLLTIEEGNKLKRFRAGSKGMAKPRVKRFAHIKIILEDSK